MCVWIDTMQPCAVSTGKKRTCKIGLTTTVCGLLVVLQVVSYGQRPLFRPDMLELGEPYAP